MYGGAPDSFQTVKLIYSGDRTWDLSHRSSSLNHWATVAQLEKSMPLLKFYRLWFKYSFALPRFDWKIVTTTLEAYLAYKDHRESFIIFSMNFIWFQVKYCGHTETIYWLLTSFWISFVQLNWSWVNISFRSSNFRSKAFLSRNRLGIAIYQVRWRDAGVSRRFLALFAYFQLFTHFSVWKKLTIRKAIRSIRPNWTSISVFFFFF